MRWPSLVLSILFLTPVFADGLVIKTEQAYPTRATPRWKMYMDPANSSRVWLLIADNRDQLFLSNDGGESYNAFRDEARRSFDSKTGGEVAAWLDNHAALCGHDDNLFITYPHGRKVFVKLIGSPANSTETFGKGWEIETDPGIGKRSTLIATDDELFVFTRTSRSEAGNLRFFRYDHAGELLESGFVEKMHRDNIRIGATLDADGRPVLVVWSGSNNRASLRYYRWNGRAFDSPKDALIWDLSDARRCDRGERTREYALAVSADDTLHVVWTCARRLVVHAHKTMGARGHWKYDELVNHKTQREYDFNTALTVHGNEIFALFSLDENPAGSDIWARRWDPEKRAWDSVKRLTTSHRASIPNTVWKVNSDAKAIPFSYWEGEEAVFSGRLSLEEAAEAAP